MHFKNQIKLPLGYFVGVDFYSLYYIESDIYIEAFENYQKRSFRNKCEILTNQNAMSLSVPLKKGKHQKMAIQEVEISYDENWVDQHIRSLQVAYSSSAYYAFYPQLIDILESRPKFLFDLNLQLHKAIMSIIGIPKEKLILTTSYEMDENKIFDYRSDFHPKTELYKNQLSYPQVFDYKFGFVSKLSILDLIYNLGPESSLYLKRLSITFEKQLHLDKENIGH